MIYIHDSEIVSHGRLKSSNCLVDSRWVLQIADFGLTQFKAPDGPVVQDDIYYYSQYTKYHGELVRLGRGTY